MAFTLQNLLVKVCYNLGVLNFGTATGGSTTTVVDTARSSASDEDAEPDGWKNGVMFITYDAGGASAAPEGEMGTISAFAADTGTFTVPTMTAAVAASDKYGYTSELYPLDALIQAANDGLADIGEMMNTDTSLTFASGTLIYDVPVAAKDIYAVEVLNDDDVYVPVHGWSYLRTAAGSVGKLQFMFDLLYDDTIRIHYYGLHPKLTVYSSTINESIDEELAMLATVNKAMEWQNSRGKGQESFDLQKWNDIKMQYAARKAEFRPPRIGRPARLNIFDNGDINA